MQFLKLSSALCYLFALVIGQDITGSQVSEGQVLFVGDTTIESGASWSIVNGAIQTFVGNLNNYGSFYVSTNDPVLSLRIAFLDAFKKISNTGKLVFQSTNGAFAPIYTLSNTAFENSGSIWFSSVNSLTHNIYSILAPVWNNDATGNLYFYSDKRSNSPVNLGGLLTTITNDGQICLVNQAWKQTTTVKGSGCIDIGKNSNLWVANSLLSFSADQTIYLSDTTSQVRVEALSATQTFKIAGYGNGNVVGISLPITSYSYDSTNGVLTVANLLLSQKFNIGTGYTNLLFQKKTVNYGGLIGTVINGGIVYNGPIPSGANKATSCRACEAVPSIPTTA